MQRHRSDVSGVILKGTLASSQHRNRTFKPSQKFRKSRNFALCLIDDFVFSKLFYTLFFVAILLIFNQFYKVTKYSAEKATEGLVQQQFGKMAGLVLNSTEVLRLNFCTKLNICASISATSPSCKPLADILENRAANNNHLK